MPPPRFRPKIEILEDRCLLSTVTNLLDNGPGSLRDAIANTPANGTVDFQQGLAGTITLTSGTLTIDKNLLISGPGASVITVSGNQSLQVFSILASPSVTISGLTVADGLAAQFGGGILNRGILILSNVTLQGNSAGASGGGIFSFGSLNLQNCNVSGNSARMEGGGVGTDLNTSTFITDSTFAGNLAENQGGGGINNKGDMTILNSTLTSNTAFGGGGMVNWWVMNFTSGTVSNNNSTLWGGGVLNYGTLNLSNSTVADNTATSEGGGFFNWDHLTLINDTIAGNATSSTGGGIYNKSALVAVYTTLAGNMASAGGGLAIAPEGLANLQNTLVAGNSATPSPDIAGFVNFADHNLVGDGTGSSGIVNGVNGNQVGTAQDPIDARLGILQNNGGPTLTMALLSGSPAIDAGGTTSFLLAIDQRGFHRIVNNAPDIGAYEYQPPDTSTTVFTSAHPSTPNQNVNVVAYVTGTAPGSNIPTGSVTFFENGQSFGTLPLVNGSASITRLFPTAGTRVLTARYNGFSVGDFQFTQSTANPFNQVVRPRTYFAASVSRGRIDIQENNLVRIYGIDGRPLYQFLFNNIHSEGRSVAVGSLTSDQYDDLVVSTGYLSSISIYSGRGIANGTFNPDTDRLYTFTLYPGYQPGKGGTVAIGDVNGDGYPDLIVGDRGGPFGFDGSEVWVFDGKAFANGTFDPQNPQASLLTHFSAYAPQFHTGVNVAVGDINGDGYADIITGTAWGNPHVKVFSGKAIADGTFDPNNPDASLLASYFAYGLQFNVGVTVAAGDVN
ncbi:MAG TPA: choice-of-anchor Q domain-containing protein, partial [Gemmataceae bacterium]|nr:choice-of-anchor Q domain-containing protein [Gemmataceae bacterium]